MALAVLVGTRLLTEFLAPSVFGTMTLLIGIAGLGRSSLSLPFTQAAQRFYFEAVRENQLASLREVLVRHLAAGTAVLLFLLLFLGPIWAAKANVSNWVILFLAGIVVVDTIRTMETCFLNAARNQRVFSLVTAADAWVRPLAAVVTVYALGVSVHSVMLGYLSGATLVLAALYVVPNARVSMHASIPTASTGTGWSRKIRRYALPLVPLAVVSWVLGLSDRYIIAALLGIGKAGLYAAGYGLASQPFTMVSSVLSLTLRPVLLAAVESGDRRRERRIFAAWLAMAAGIVLALALLIGALADPIVSIFLAKEYRSAATFLPWIASGYALQSIGFVFAELWLAHKKPRLYLCSTLLGAIASLVLCVWLVQVYGLIGAAISCPIYFAVVVLFNILATWFFIGRDYFFISSWKSSPSGLS